MSLRCHSYRVTPLGHGDEAAHAASEANAADAIGIDMKWRRA